MKNGGWLHDPPANFTPPVAPVNTANPQCTADRVRKFTALTAQCERNTPGARRELANKLTVSVEALEKLRVGKGYFFERWATTWPERDAKGRIIGINRRFMDGEKRCLPGSKRGLYFADDWRESAGPVFLVEGGSDTAAGITMGLSAVGRPSAQGGQTHLTTLLSGVEKGRRIVVMGERDRKEDGRWPGKEGARALWKGLREGLGRRVEWRLPPGGRKDLRAYWAALGVDPNAKDLAHSAGRAIYQ